MYHAAKGDGNEISMMENITYVMAHTANNYNDCMDMPIAVLMGIVKELKITELCQNPEWRKAYLLALAKEKRQQRRTPNEGRR